jgi:non-heme chloroperoxidase
MPFFNSSIDGALLHYVDYQPAITPPPFQPTTLTNHALSSSKTVLVFIHGWPMSARMYEHLTLKLSETHRIRCAASDRRGFGKSEWLGKKHKNITYDTFAADTIAFVEQLELDDDETFVFIASSMGCGETLLAYKLMSPALQDKFRGFIWLGPSLPFPMKTDAHPEGPPRELWDMILSGFRADRTGFTRASMPGVFGIGPQFSTGIELPATVLEKFEGIVAEADPVAVERCVMAITHRDFTEELKELNGTGVNLVVLHGDQDQGQSFRFQTYV